MKRLLLSTALALIPIREPLIIGTTAAVVLTAPQTAQAESAEFYDAQGYEKYLRGDYDGAIADYTKAIELNPRNAKAYFNRGNAKGKLEAFYAAIADYTKAIEINPRYADAYTGRGILKFVLGDRSGGCTDAREAESLGSQSGAGAEFIRELCQ